ncbi:FCD domain-containing protein [Roseomonas sp. NAR14]|uniref:FCD domain-containing protein n=1 Tax=Roseomonas acroporae TaxID=2937791 RepID=A0A9X2BUB9_9PROT|nr:FCD domain-containing protein [Roseomonas acroporae]MCK8785352.1 FCD domain-containing protein [Roseomonas acroporae]
MEFRRLQPQPAYRQVSAEIERRILAGALKPGEALPSEAELAAGFGVNRSTVREGIRALESEGLLRRAAGKRLVIAAPRAADLAPRAARALAMQRVTFEELWSVALALEPMAARLAARHAAPAEVAALADTIARTDAVLARGESPAALDTEFHALVSEAAHNRALLLSREPVGALLYPAAEPLMPRLPQANDRMQAAHRHVVEAIGRRDEAGAELWMRRHIVDFRRGYEMVGLALDAPVAPPARPE